MMPESQPILRRVFDAVERPVGVMLESLVQTEGFADVAALVTKWQNEPGRRIGRITRQVLQLGDVPVATDVKRVEQRLVAVERRLWDLSRHLEQPEEEP